MSAFVRELRTEERAQKPFRCGMPGARTLDPGGHFAVEGGALWVTATP